MTVRRHRSYNPRQRRQAARGERMVTLLESRLDRLLDEAKLAG
jgi:hypothetical protein